MVFSAAVVLVVLAALCSPPAQSDLLVRASEPPSTVARSEQDRANPALLERVGAIMERVLAEHHVAGALVAIAKDGRLVLDQGYGVASFKPRVPMQPGMTGCLGSVTKPITAAAILKLREEGKLDIEDRLIDVLSDLRPFPGLRIADPRFRDIRVHHLLFHGGGFGSQWAKSPHYDRAAERAKARGARQRVYVGAEVAALDYRLAMSTPLKFAPGTDHSYSNFGFVTLRLVVERASGTTYEDYCERHVLRPMGIRSFRLDSKGEIYFPGESHRFNYSDGRYVDVGGGVGPGGAGNWVAPMADMVRFLVALGGSQGKPFFKKETMDLMLGPPPPPFAKDTSRSWPGLGFGVHKTAQGLSYSKNGGVSGAGTWIEHIAQGNIDFAVWMNTTHRGDAETEVTGPGAMGAANRELRNLFQQLEKWPEIDLFED
jgi:N-acyl-D-amino-acid deacylase